MIQQGEEELESKYILGMRVDGTSYQDTIDQIFSWIKQKSSSYICVSNVHMTMETYDDTDFRNVVNSADLVVPDGMPLVWVLKLLGIKKQGRVSGPDLTIKLLKEAEKNKIPVAFYGSAQDTLNKLKERLEKQFPELIITELISPPYRSLTSEEQLLYIDKINKSGTKILFVGLGCPKQEKWMFENRERIESVMLGVGAAFDFIAGNKKRAPKFMQFLGLEWLFRLLSEPRRLFKRYFKHNVRFLWLTLTQLLGFNKK